MKTATCDKKTCKRCSGKGTYPTAKGPGQCWECVGFGFIAIGESARVQTVGRLESQLKGIEAVAADLKTAIENASDEFMRARMVARLEAQRANWVRVNRELQTAKGV